MKRTIRKNTLLDSPKFGDVVFVLFWMVFGALLTLCGYLMGW